MQLDWPVIFLFLHFAVENVGFQGLTDTFKPNKAETLHCLEAQQEETIHYESIGTKYPSSALSVP